MTRRCLSFALVLSFYVAVACDAPGYREANPEARPQAITNQEDAVCGMLVREQSAPRAQLLHRDGTRQFFCSAADLLSYLDAPSPYGAVVQIHLELMDPSEDPALTHTQPHPWIDAHAATFVVGIERRAIMGPPVLVYRDTASAEIVMAGHPTARALDFEGLRAWWKRIQAGEG